MEVKKLSNMDISYEETSSSSSEEEDPEAFMQNVAKT
jgi:hypothetical protein